MEDYGSWSVDDWVRPNDPEVVYPDVYYQQGDGGSASQSESAMYGTGNTLPTVSTQEQVAGQSGDVLDDVTGFIKKFGQIGTAVTQTARELGKAVGAIEQGAGNAQGAFEAGRADARRYVGVQSWWDSTPTTDKLLIGLAVAGLVYTLTAKGG